MILLIIIFVKSLKKEGIKYLMIIKKKNKLKYNASKILLL